MISVRHTCVPMGVEGVVCGWVGVGVEGCESGGVWVGRCVGAWVGMYMYA